MNTSNGSSQTNWFIREPVYTGRARLIVANPQAILTGSGTITCKADGRLTVQFEVEDIEAAEPGFHLWVHLSSPARDPEGRLASTVTQKYTDPRAKYESVEIVTPEGRFISHRIIIGSCSFGSTGTTIRLRLADGRFDCTAGETATYWVLPLTNYLPESVTPDGELRHHPLRLRKVAPCPGNATDKERLLSECHARNETLLVRWSMFGSSAFIDRVQDFTHQKERLVTHSSVFEITSVAVGHIPEASIGVPARDWFPFRMLTAVSLANGSLVGAPWIEYRNDNGQLLAREHTGMIVWPFRSASAMLEELSCKHTGLLIETVLASTAFSESHLTGILHLLCRLAEKEGTTDDKWTRIARLTELLAHILRLQCCDLTSGFPEELREQVSNILKQTRTDLRALSENYPTHKEKLQTIADRASGAASKESMFTAALRQLIERFEFSDKRILDEDYDAFPRSHGRQWLPAMGKFRSDVIHRAFNQFEDGTERDGDHLEATLHLHDLLLRAFFCLIRYTGTYSPPCATMAGAYTVDWVKDDTPAYKLGYHRTIDY